MMDRSTRDFGLIFDENMEKVVGVSIGHVSTSVQEEGLKRIRSSLGMSTINFEKQLKKYKEKDLGVNNRLVTSDEEIQTGHFNYDNENFYYFYVGYNIDDEKVLKTHILRAIEYDMKGDIFKYRASVAWDEEEFVFVVGEMDKEVVEKLREAAADSKLYFGPFSSDQFTGASTLSVVLTDYLSDDFRKNLIEYDKSTIELEREHRSLNIKGVLDKKNKDWKEEHQHTHNSPWSYIALSPRWNEKSDKTKYKISYWLNPSNQDLVKSGMFTVEEIYEWMNEEDCRIVPKENWELLKWRCQTTLNSTLYLEYKDFPENVEPNHASRDVDYTYASTRSRQKRANAIKTFANHILWIYVDNCRNNMRLKNIQSPFGSGAIDDRTEERTFGIAEAMAIQGLGYMGACNTPKDIENTSWLRDILYIKAIFIVAKEQGIITQDEEDRFLKPTLKLREEHS